MSGPLPPTADAALSPSMTPGGSILSWAPPSLPGPSLAAGSIDSDDFNRATLGSGWTQVGGANFSIVTDRLTSASGNE